MPAYPYARKIMDYTSTGAAPATITGTAYKFVTRDLTPNLEETKVRFTARVVRVGGTSPTAAVFIEFSVDQVHWTPLQVLSLSGSPTEASVVLPDTTDAQPFVRARVEVGGAPRPQLAVVVEMVCSDPFNLV